MFYYDAEVGPELALAMVKSFWSMPSGEELICFSLNLAIEKPGSAQVPVFLYLFSTGIRPGRTPSETDPMREGSSRRRSGDA